MDRHDRDRYGLSEKGITRLFMQEMNNNIKKLCVDTVFTLVNWCD